MRRLGASISLALAAAAAFAADDSWEGSEPDSSGLLMSLMTIPGDVTIDLASNPWSDANGPARVEPPLSNEEKDELARCRGLVAKGDHEAAGKALDALLAKNAADWDAHVVRAASLHAQKSDAEAAAALRTSLVGNRRDPDAWKLLDDVAKALGKRVARPKIDLRGWVRERAKGAVEVGYVAADKVDGPWNYYAAARAVYRWGGHFKTDFPEMKAYAFTFREQMYAVGVLAVEAAAAKKEGKSLPADLVRVLAEKKAGTLAPFAFFAAYPEALTATPEKGFDALRPRLEKYFDEKILVKR